MATISSALSPPDWINKVSKVQQQLNWITPPLIDPGVLKNITTAVSLCRPHSWIEDINVLSQQFSNIGDSLANLSLMQNIAMTFDTSILQNTIQAFQRHSSELIETMQYSQDIISQNLSDVMEFANRLQDVLPNIIMPQLHSEISDCLQDWSHSIADAMENDWELSRLIGSLGKITNEIQSAETLEISEEEKQIAAAEIKVLLSEDKNWEQRFAERIRVFAETHPVVARILIVFWTLFLSIIGGFAHDALGQVLQLTKVYNEPTSSSQVIYNIQQNYTFVIVGDVPYYYEIEIRDAVSNQTVNGYVSKRSVHLCECNNNATRQSP